MSSLSVAFPAFNEEESLEKVVREFIVELQQRSIDFEIVLLDDGSTDHTRAIIERLAVEFPTVIATVYHEQNTGIAVSFQDVQRAASKEYVILVGADGQYPPEIISTCLPYLDAYDVIICKRRQKHYSLYRAVISGSYRWMCRLLFGIDLLDPGGAKVIRRSLVDELPLRSHSVFVQPEQVIRAVWGGYRIKFVEVTCIPRQAGKAKGCHFSLIVFAFRDLCALWWERYCSKTSTRYCFLQKRIEHDE